LAGVRTAGNLAAGGAVGAYRAELPQFVPDAEFPPGGDAAGGAVAAAGPLAVARATASGDRALGGDSSGKCSFCATGPASGAARGGWLQAAGAAVVALSTADGARADSGEAEFLLTGRLQFQLGYPSGPATGGAVDAGRDLTLTATSVSGSRARKGEGRAPAPASSAGGAAHAAGRLTVTGGRFTGNVAGRDALDVLGGAGGALAGADVRLTGVTLDANVAAAAGGGAWSSGPLTATRTAFTGNRGGLHGGGAHADGALTATDVRATGNAADGLGLNTGTLTGTGGGLDADGALRLTRTTVTGNSGNVVFDAVGFGRLPGAFAGAGVHGGSVVAVDSTVAGNDAVGLEVPPPPGEPVPPSRRTTGAGVHAAGAADLTNTTVSDNRLDRRAFSLEDTPTERAGGVAAADLRLVHATITGNTVVESTPFAPEPQPAAAAGALQAERLTAVGTVVVAAPGLRTCVAGVAAAGPSSYDVLGDATCTLTGPGVRTTAAGAALGPVADNGGPVPTQLPGPGSTLVDAVPVAACPVSADARGVPRPQGPACDVGAVEVTPAGG
jgi:hypothetical protein